MARERQEFQVGEIDFAQLALEEQIATFLKPLGFCEPEESEPLLDNVFRVIANLKKYGAITLLPDSRCLPLVFESQNVLAIISPASVVGLIACEDNIFKEEGMVEEDEEVGLILPRRQFAAVNYVRPTETGFKYGFVAYSKSRAECGIAALTRMRFGRSGDDQDETSRNYRFAQFLRDLDSQ